MRRSIGRGDFRRAGQSTDPFERVGAWWVCEEYEIKQGWIVAKYPYSFSYSSSTLTGLAEEYPRHVKENLSHWKSYLPLEEAPDLYLKLASLYEAEDFQTAALEFSRTYGLPGDANIPLWEQKDRAEVFSFRVAVRRAWLVLRLYEAALNRDGDAAGELLTTHGSQVLDTTGNLRSLRTPPFLRAYPNDDNRENCAEAIEEAVSVVEDAIQALCNPVFNDHPDYEADEVSGLRRGWDFKALWGAAYLQMYWLMTSAGEVVRCENCHRIMSLTRPKPDGRKIRRDKRFCSNSCKQAHYRSTKKAKPPTIQT